MIRIGNVSGFYGDRFGAVGEMLDGGEIDLLRRRTFGDRVRRVLQWVLDLDLG